MRHKYDTRGIVLARAPFGEAHVRLALLTRDLGLVWARATALRRSGGKLAAALVTLAESDLMLVRGREGWRVTGAVLAENWCARLAAPDAKYCAARVAGLVLRLSPGESPEAGLHSVMRDFFGALAERPASREAAELIAAAGVLAALGWGGEDSGLAGASFSPEHLARAARERERYVARINRGIEASGL